MRTDLVLAIAVSLLLALGVACGGVEKEAQVVPRPATEAEGEPEEWELREVDWSDLTTGDCFEDPGDLAVTTVQLVHCSSPSALRVTNFVSLVDYSSLPGDDELDSIAESRCAAEATSYFVPEGTSWLFHRGMVCIREP